MDILTVDLNSENAGVNFCQSLHETGFAVIRNNNIDYELVKKIFSEWQQFFNTKHKFDYPYNRDKGDGYVGQDLSEVAKGADVPDIKEFFQIYQPWGRFPKQLSNNTLIYFRQVFELGVSLLKWLDKFSPVAVKESFSEPLANMASIERTMLRILHYPPFNGNEQEGAVRAAAHEDINLLTLLPASNSMGLQVKTKDNRWLDVGTSEGDIIINVGDMLQECSDSYYISTTHQVVNPNCSSGIDNRSRFSMPVFVHPRNDVYLSHRYHTADDYLNERLVELGLRDEV